MDDSTIRILVGVITSLDSTRINALLVGVIVGMGGLSWWQTRVLGTRK